MKKHRVRKSIKWLIILILIIGAAIWAKNFFTIPPEETTPIEKPDNRPDFAKMSKAERNEVVNQAAKDAASAAQAIGQSSKEAQSIGQSAAETAKQTIERSVAADADK